MGLQRTDFEDRGWVFLHTFREKTTFIKGNLFEDDGRGAHLDVEGFNVRMTTTDKGFSVDGPIMSVKFNGVCETMDLFDQVCHMIRLKIQ